MRVACVLMALAMLAASAPAAADAYAPFAAPLDFRLANGLRIVAQYDRRQPLVAFAMAYGVGMRDDPPGYEGLAHLVEHLSYGGSRHLAPNQMALELERAGALRWNGATGPDYTEYYCLLSARQIALPFWLESERLGFTLERFNASFLAHEKKIVASEMLGGAPSRVELEFGRALFPGNHPYRVSDPGDASRATLEGVQWFFQQAYRPDNATLVIVGDFERATLETLAKRYFGPIPNPPGRFERKRPEPRQFHGAERVVVTEHLIPRPTVLMAWPAPPTGSPETETFLVFMFLLGKRGAGSIDAVLKHWNVVESASVMSDQRDGNGLLLLEIPLGNAAKHHEVESAVDRHFRRLRGTLLPEGEVRRAREYVRLASLAELADPLDHAHRHVESLSASGHPYRIGERFARLDAVTPASLRAFARKYFDPEKRLAAWHRWPGDEEKVSADGLVSYDDGQ